MRRVFIFLLFALLVQIKAKAQYNVVGLGANLFSFVPRGTYERSFSNLSSVILGVEGGKYSSSSIGTTTSMSEYSNIKGFGIMPEIRLYPFSKYKAAPLGFYLGTHFRYRWLTETYNSSVSKAPVYDYGVNTGYKFNSSMLVIDLLIGTGVSSGTDVFLSSDERDIFSRFRLELKVGILFPEILY